MAYMFPVQTRLVNRRRMLKEILSFTAFVAVLLLMCSFSASKSALQTRAFIKKVCCLGTRQTPCEYRKTTQNHKRPNEFPTMCGSLDYLPTLTNWTVDRWLDVTPEKRRWWKISEVFKVQPFRWRANHSDSVRRCTIS